ncbi:hypothetical protein CU098_010839 [Rhizopus stolonifer]|uniref:Reverse transcriptase zinc-binding domain-containing protein n=1 Tax=Rhizopus stolonifer TaxID=4846 RepID=A0A367K1W2_RHIST|nr:hypothetical protein CU098_010839 [Rhizopus stolonifer]
MSSYDRNRIIRWRRGWLPSKPEPCGHCGTNNFTTRNYLILCYHLLPALNISHLQNEPHPLDSLLNQLPSKPPTTEPLKTKTYLFWLHCWPLILQFLKDIDHDIHVDSQQVIDAMATKPELLLDSLYPDN